jgi:hypothetical protein
VPGVAPNMSTRPPGGVLGGTIHRRRSHSARDTMPARLSNFLRKWLASRSGRRPRSVARRGGLRLVTHNPGMLEDRVASDRRRGPRCRHVAILGAAEDGKPLNLKVEGCHATADFRRDNLLDANTLRGSRHRRRFATTHPVSRREEDESVTQVASMAGDTSADNEAGGHGETLARATVLS